MIMITLTIVMLAPAVGVILPIALIAAPTAALASWTHTMSRLLIGAPIPGAMTSLAGLLIVVQLNPPTGGVITVACEVVYLVSALLHWAATRGAWVRVSLLHRG